MDLSNAVSETALITLRARAEATRAAHPVLHDPMSVALLEQLAPLLAADTHARLLGRRLPAALTTYVAHRSRKYDDYARRFLGAHAEGCVVSLGCGFDTRYWRIGTPSARYVEVDLPPVVEAKRQVLRQVRPGPAAYRMIGGSVLEEAWLGAVAALQRTRVLFIAEGLLMYLPADGVARLFERLATTFSRSEIVFEVVHARYTRGVWKQMATKKMQRRLGTTADAAYRYGLRHTRDVEAYDPRIRVAEAWSYFEDPDLRPRVLTLLRHLPLFTRTQWTIRATVG
jgi:methyltransferase (TIGR00027 family)